MSSTTRKIEAKIKKKDQEIHKLEDDMNDIEAMILTLHAEKRGMEEVLKILPREETGAESRTIRANSAAGKVQRLLRKHGKPMYIADIVVGIKKANNHNNRASLAGTLNSYFRNEEIFTRPESNTFGLLEWGSQESGQEDTPESNEDELIKVAPAPSAPQTAFKLKLPSSH